MGLIGPDEPRYAWVAREMARSGDWVTPRLWGEPWFEKPALLYWMTASAFRFGFGNDSAPRLPVACWSLLFLGFFYWRLKAEFGGAAAGYGAAVLATSAGWVAYSHAAIVDLPLAAAFSASMLSLLAWLERRDERWAVAFAALMGIAVLAKGLVAPVLAALALLAWSLRMPVRPLLGLGRPVTVLVFLAVAAPWYTLCYARNGSVFLQEFFWKHHFARFATGALEHHQPVWFFLPVVAIGLLPWTPLLATLGRARMAADRRSFFLAVWAGVSIVFFSLSRDKLPAYVLPALPPLAALVGIALAREECPMRVPLPLCALLLGLMPAAAAILPEALGAGVGTASRVAFGPLVLLGVALAAGVAAIGEFFGRRAAVASIVLCAVGGYGLIKQVSFPSIDARAGTRSLWNEARAYRDSLCVGEVRRHVEYGLNYYAERVLPSCEESPQPHRIEDHKIVAEP